MKTLNLGFKDPYHNEGATAMPEPAAKQTEPRIVYPSVSLEGDAAKAFMRQYGAEDEATITMRVRVAMAQHRGEGREHWEKPGCRVELECREIQGMESGGDEDGDESASEAPRKYMKEKARE